MFNRDADSGTPGHPGFRKWVVGDGGGAVGEGGSGSGKNRRNVRGCRMDSTGGAGCACGGGVEEGR